MGAFRHPSPLPLLHSLEGWNERLVFDAYELGPEDVQAVIDETGVPAGWNPLIVGYDRLPEAPDGIEIPEGLTDFLATLEHRQLAAGRAGEDEGPPARACTRQAPAPRRRSRLRPPRARTRRRAPPWVRGSRSRPRRSSRSSRSRPSSTRSPSTGCSRSFKAEGVVSPPLRKAELEEYIDITLVRMLGYRWPEQDAYEADHGPILDADLVDADGIIPLVPCGDEPVAEERVRTRLVRQLGDDGADAFLADLKRYTKRDLADWIRRDFFKAHTKRFKNRPDRLAPAQPRGRLRGDRPLPPALARDPRQAPRHLRRRPPRAPAGRPAAGQGARRHRAPSPTSRSQIEDVEAFRPTLAAIEQGTELRHRIRCRWKGETDAGRPGPYAPDIDDGVKVNIRPFQESGLLPAKVISKW